jgi:hypothetical protein
MIKEIKEFIGTAKHDEFKGTYIWGVDKNGGHQMIAELRGWGAIQNMFKNKDGSINFKDAEQFQDELGKFIVEAINEKINNNKALEDNKDEKYTEEDMIAFAYQFSNINVADFRKHLKDFDINLKEKNKHE